MKKKSEEERSIATLNMRAASREPGRLPEIREGQREIYQREGWATHGRSLGQVADRRGLWEEQLLL